MRAALLALLATACIERAYDAQAIPLRAAVDRSQLREVLLPPPPDATPVGAIYNNQVELVAWKLEPPALVPGERAKLTLYWKCLAEVEPWHVFVHLDDVNGSGARIHAEHDPAGGRFPTEAWKPGDFISDPISFTAGRDPLYLFVGFYSQGETRLPLTSPGRGRDDGNHRLLAGVLPAAK